MSVERDAREWAKGRSRREVALEIRRIDGKIARDRLVSLEAEAPLGFAAAAADGEGALDRRRAELSVVQAARVDEDTFDAWRRAGPRALHVTRLD